MEYINGDVFLAPEKSCICHQVNTYGAMGKGIALSVKIKYPRVYTQYKRHLEDLILSPYGTVLFCGIDNNRYIANCFSQIGWKTDYDLFEKCLHVLADTQCNYFAIPYKMGCGLAGGNWTVISNLIEKILGDRAFIYRFEVTE